MRIYVCEYNGTHTRGMVVQSQHAAVSFTLNYQRLSEETLKTDGPFYLVSMPGEVNVCTDVHM